VQAKNRGGVSARTILRDVEALNLAGIPIVTYQGEGGGISIAEGYRLDRSVLSGEDMASVLGMLKGIDGTVSSRKHEILIEKLKNSLPSPQREKLEANLNRLVIDFSPWKENDAKKEAGADQPGVDATLIGIFYVTWKATRPAAGWNPIR
jgi:predicted DNA-binding transcriptional regulator YafY